MLTADACTSCFLPAKMRVPLKRLRPTQAAVGMRAVALKRRKVEKHVQTPSKIERYLDHRPIPSIIGPGGHLFMIDHHHLALALWQAEIETAFVVVIEDFSVLPVAMFWSRMEEGGWVRPFDEDGRRIAPTKLPKRLKGLRADRYRDLSWSVREAGGFEKSPQPYSEFLWADYFRSRVSERLIAKDYEAAVAKALKLSRSHQARHLPGFAAN
jgi:hypothetical protein